VLRQACQLCVVPAWHEVHFTEVQQQCLHAGV
jgi:hypothetical protein